MTIKTSNHLQNIFFENFGFCDFQCSNQIMTWQSDNGTLFQSDSRLCVRQLRTRQRKLIFNRKCIYTILREHKLTNCLRSQGEVKCGRSYRQIGPPNGLNRAWTSSLEDLIEFKLNNFKVTACSNAPFNLIVYDLMKILVPILKWIKFI